MKPEEWDEITDRNKEAELKSKGGIILLEGFDHDPDSMVVYEKGIVELVNTSEKNIPFEVRIGDFIVYNHGALVQVDKGKNEKKKTVKYADIICLFRYQ